MSSGGLEVQLGFASEPGRRPANEDYAGAYLGTPGQRARYGVAAAMADGIGGARGGRVAAELAVRDFIEGYYSQSETLEVHRAASNVLQSISRWIHALGRRDPALEGMGAAFAAVVLLGRKAHVVHVGDTRVYRLSGDQLTRLTEDHTLSRPGMTHVLCRAVGAEDTVRVDYNLCPFKLHDRFLLCTDGVHNALPDKRIRDILARRSAPEEAAKQMVAAALAADASDNASAIVIDVVAVPAVDHADVEMALGALPIGTPPRSGETIDGFLIESVLSEGRYSTVYVAQDGTGGRRVVLKFPAPRLVNETSCRAAFLREAWVASVVNSPYIGDVIEIAPERRSRLYTVMPYYEGETLERRLARKPAIALGEGVGIIVKLAKGIAALHRAGVIHRDIKPDNVILEPAGGVKLLDLGVARVPKIDDPLDEGIPGTASYMAPELFDGARGDEHTDLFALGVTAYRMFSGAYPYGEIEPFSHPRFDKPAPLSRKRPDLPAWLDQALARAVAVSPSERYADVMELAAEIENGLARGGTVVTGKPPLYHRNPLRFWQIVSILLAAALIAALAIR